MESISHQTVQPTCFRGRVLTEFTVDELAKVCLETTGKPLSTKEALDLVRSGVKISLSQEDEAYIAQRKDLFRKSLSERPTLP